MSPLDLALYVFAIYYLTFAITTTHGIGGMFAWARERLPHGGLLICFVCLSLWIAIAVYLLWLLAPVAIVIVGSAGAACAVYYLTSR